MALKLSQFSILKLAFRHTNGLRDTRGQHWPINLAAVFVVDARRLVNELAGLALALSPAQSG